MSHSSRRAVTALSSPSRTQCGKEHNCKCCIAIRRARERALFDTLPQCASPLTPGVQLVNLSVSEDGRALRADLGNDWARMLGQLPFVGPGLVMTRNEACILGRRMPYPALNVTSGSGKGASGAHGLWTDFRQFGAARAVHSRTEEGHIFGVEFADCEGRIIHRYTLTSESDFDAFFDWVRLHQACEALWLDGACEDEPAGMHDVKPHVSQRASDAGAVAAIFAACLERKLAVKTTVIAGAVRHCATLLPCSVVPQGDWWFASDDVTGLHFAPTQLTKVEVVGQRGTGETRPLLRCSTEEHTTALLLEAGEDTAAEAWRELLHTVA